MGTYGLTGGIGSGKTYVANRLRELGAYIIDADQIAREFRETPRGRSSIRIAFGNAVFNPDGSVNAAALREAAYADEEGKAFLDQVRTHNVTKLLFAHLREAQIFEHKPIIVDAALLIETEYFREFGGLIVTVCGRETQLVRVLDRDQCSLETANKILDLQTTDSERRRWATWVIDTAGTKEWTRTQAENVWDAILEREGRNVT